MKKALTVSLIIPVYNEARHLKACLEAVALQTVKPLEVIVVDNNSTDDSARIAKQFSFVTLVHEAEQGLIPTRNRGFKLAKGDILARIDGDTFLLPEWIASLQQVFQDSDVGGATGPGIGMVESHFPNWQSTFWSRVYHRFALSVFRFDVMWGANMALRRKVWLKIKNQAATEDTFVHEDQDLSVLVTAADYKIQYTPTLCVRFDATRSAYLPKAMEYENRRKKTIKLHRTSGSLQRAQELRGISSLRAAFLWLSVLPAGPLYTLISGMYTLELKLGLRKHPR